MVCVCGCCIYVPVVEGGSRGARTGGGQRWSRVSCGGAGGRGPRGRNRGARPCGSTTRRTAPHPGPDTAGSATGGDARGPGPADTMDSRGLEGGSWVEGGGERGGYLKGEEAVGVVMAGTELGVKQRTHRMHRLGRRGEDNTEEKDNQHPLPCADDKRVDYLFSGWGLLTCGVCPSSAGSSRMAPRVSPHRAHGSSPFPPRHTSHSHSPSGTSYTTTTPHMKSMG